jgi:hypothetical protein
VAVVRLSPTVTIGVHEKPGASVGTRIMEIPRCFLASGSVRQASQTQSASLAPLVKILVPLMTYSSPSRTARVCSDARSVPAEGSEYPMAKFTSPARICGRKVAFCSSEPYRISVGPTVFRVTNGTGAFARWTSS